MESLVLSVIVRVVALAGTTEQAGAIYTFRQYSHNRRGGRTKFIAVPPSGVAVS